jgi:hypothetical protein
MDNDLKSELAGVLDGEFDRELQRAEVGWVRSDNLLIGDNGSG